MRSRHHLFYTAVRFGVTPKPVSCALFIRAGTAPPSDAESRRLDNTGVVP